MHKKIILLLALLFSYTTTTLSLDCFKECFSSNKASVAPLIEHNGGDEKSDKKAASQADALTHDDDQVTSKSEALQLTINPQYAHLLVPLLLPRILPQHALKRLDQQKQALAAVMTALATKKLTHTTSAYGLVGAMETFALDYTSQIPPALLHDAGDTKADALPTSPLYIPSRVLPTISAQRLAQECTQHKTLIEQLEKLIHAQQLTTIAFIKNSTDLSQAQATHIVDYGT